jgi:threonyl-tRNA synthetase
LPKKEKAEAEKVSEALKAEEKLESFWYILQPDGKMVPVEEFDFRGLRKLEKFAKYEISKVRASQQMPPHVPLMKRLEIADYELEATPEISAGTQRVGSLNRLLNST